MDHRAIGDLVTQRFQTGNVYPPSAASRRPLVFRPCGEAPTLTYIDRRGVHPSASFRRAGNRSWLRGNLLRLAASQWAARPLVSAGVGRREQRGDGCFLAATEGDGCTVVGRR